jgi:hypothetical protein
MLSFAAEPAAKIGNPPQCHGWGVRQICYDPKDKEWRSALQPSKYRRALTAAQDEYREVNSQLQLQKLRDSTADLRAQLRK